MTTAPRLKRDPWIKFYFADWRAEPRLKMCSRAARSLWLDMLGLMHEAQPYGFLLVEGIAPNTAQLANLVGDPERQVKGWLEELRAAGVFSVVGQPMPDDVHDLLSADVPDGTFLSRRMVRDAARRERDKANGKGGGNPKLRGEGVNPPDNPESENRRSRDNPKARGGLKPRSQKPETRLPPNPPTAAVIPPPHPSWSGHTDRARRVFSQKFCDFVLFPCAIVPLSGSEVVLEAGTRSGLSRVRVESQRLHELFAKSVTFRLAEDSAP